MSEKTVWNFLWGCPWISIMYLSWEHSRTCNQTRSPAQTFNWHASCYQSFLLSLKSNSSEEIKSALVLLYLPWHTHCTQGTARNQCTDSATQPRDHTSMAFVDGSPRIISGDLMDDKEKWLSHFLFMLTIWISIIYTTAEKPLTEITNTGVCVTVWGRDSIWFQLLTSTDRSECKSPTLAAEVS